MNQFTASREQRISGQFSALNVATGLVSIASPRPLVSLTNVTSRPKVHQSLLEKMHLLASHANDLTVAGKVKAMTRNEKGYAKLFSVNRGCRVWLHHTLDDKLILDLMVTKNGKLKHPDVVESAIAKFSQFADQAGRSVSHCQWQHAINNADLREQYYFEVTNERVAIITALIDEVQLVFQSP